MPTIALSIPPRIERQFKAAAKKAWPKETYAIVLGTIAGDHVHIDELFIPEGVEKSCTPKGVVIQPEWLLEAQEYAKEEDLQILADLHSHPWYYSETLGAIQDRVQSEGDIDCPVKFLLMGICNVQETKKKGLRASIRWHGPTIRVDVKRES